MKKHIAFVGLTGFPNEPSASINRCLMISKLLSNLDWEISYINHWPYNNIDKNINLDFQFELKSNNFYSKHFFNSKYYRFLLKKISWLADILNLLKINRKSKITVLYVYNPHIFNIVIYRLLSFFINSKVCLSYVEFRSKIVGRDTIGLKLNDYLFDNYAMYLCDGVNPISNSIEKHVRDRRHSVKQLRIPPLFDFNLVLKNELITECMPYKYFLYCGSTSYIEIIENIITAYVMTKSDIKLLLILNGPMQKINKSSVYLKNKGNIIIKSDLKYNLLISYMCNAFVLLIPLRNNIQDIYRFPNKIAEYTFAKRPIITTNIGEISYYFEDKKNAIFAKSESSDDLLDSMNWCLNHVDLISNIGLEAFSIGEKHFSTSSIYRELDKFLLQL